MYLEAKFIMPCSFNYCLVIFQSGSSSVAMKSPTKLPHFFSPGMLPPPPPPPPNLARPVAILRTSDGNISSANSLPTSSKYLLKHFGFNWFHMMIYEISCVFVHPRAVARGCKTHEFRKYYITLLSHDTSNISIFHEVNVYFEKILCKDLS